MPRIPLLTRPLPTLLALLAAASPAAAQADITAYREVEPVPLPDSLTESHRDDAFRSVVLRRAATPEARRLIERAESLYPPAEAVDAALRAAMGPDVPPGWAERVAAPDSLEGPRWWWHAKGRTLLPYAVTGSAVAHYLTLIQELAAGPDPSAGQGEPVRRATFRYLADVDCGGRGGSCTVTLRLWWTHVCGGHCGISLSHFRSVTFDADGRVVGIRGDGPPRYAES